MIDKSNGEGCIGCKFEKGKTCEDCTHDNDTVNKCRAINAENAKAKEQKNEN